MKDSGTEPEKRGEPSVGCRSDASDGEEEGRKARLAVQF